MVEELTKVIAKAVSKHKQELALLRSDVNNSNEKIKILADADELRNKYINQKVHELVDAIPKPKDADNDYIVQQLEKELSAKIEEIDSRTINKLSELKEDARVQNEKELKKTAKKANIAIFNIERDVEIAIREKFEAYQDASKQSIEQIIFDEVAKIPKPKDGKDAKVDYEKLTSTIDKKKLVKEIDYDNTKNRLTIYYTDNTRKEIFIKQRHVSLGGGGSRGNTSSGGSVEYIRSTPTEISVGGVGVGETFSGTVADALDKILYPYIKPTFSSFSILGFENKEVGDTIPAQTSTFNWITTKDENIKTNTIKITDVTNANMLVENSQNDGTEDVSTPEYANIVPASQVFEIEAIDTKENIFKKTYTVEWQNKMHYGASIDTSLDDAGVTALAGELSTTRVKTVTYDCSGGKYFYIAYPQAWGDMDDTKINNLSWNDWVLEKRDYVNEFGIITPYNIYRSYNQLNGSVTVDWS